MPRPESAARNAVSSLADVLLAARQRVGLSQRQLAALLGLGKGTIHAVEGARDPLHSTLDAYVRRLPGLDARTLFPGLPPCPPASSGGAWLAAAELHGLTAERVSLAITFNAERTDGESRLEIKGVKPSGWDRDDTVVRSALIEAICGGSPAVTEAFAQAPPSRRGKLRVEDGATVHELVLPRTLSDRGISYRRSEPLGTASLEALQGETPKVSASLEFPAKTLAIDVQLPKGVKARDVHCLAWPQGASPDAGLARFLHPEGVDLSRGARGRRLRLAIDLPIPVLRHALAWTEEGDDEQSEPVQGAARARPLEAEKEGRLAHILRQARETAGLSLRELARRMDMSQVTVREVERGREPRWSTLSKYLRTLPEELSPQQLFSAPETTDLALSREELWEYYRDLIGFEAREILKSVEIEANGSSETAITTSNLRSNRTDLHDLRVRHGVASVLQVATSVLEEIETEEGVLNRTDAGKHGPVKHQLRIPRRVGRAGISHVRRFKGGQFYLTGKAVHGAIGGPPPYIEGSGLPLLHPVKSLTLRVLFPRDYVPTSVQAFMLPMSVLPGSDLMSISGSPLKVRHGKKKGRKTVSAQVDLPIPGSRILLTWELPGG